MKKLLTEIEVPYLFVVLLVIIGFWLNKTISTDTEIPLIVYDTKKVEDWLLTDDTSKTRYTAKFDIYVENYNKYQALLDLQFKVNYPSLSKDEYKFLRGEVIPIAPADRGEDFARIADGEYIDFYVPSIQPEGKYVLNFELESDSDVLVCPELFLHSENSAVLKEKNLGHWFLKNRYFVNWIMTFILIVILIIYMIFYSRTEVRTKDNNG